MPTTARNHRSSPAWRAAALDVWAAGPGTPTLAVAGCPHMPEHTLTLRPTRPKIPPRRPPLSGMPGAQKPPTGNGPPPQLHTARSSVSIHHLPAVPAWLSTKARMQLVHPNHRPMIGARVCSGQIQIIRPRGANIHTPGSSSPECPSVRSAVVVVSVAEVYYRTRSSELRSAAAFPGPYPPTFPA